MVVGNVKGRKCALFLVSAHVFDLFNHFVPSGLEQ